MEPLLAGSSTRGIDFVLHGTIDIRDYVNRIGNHSCEQYVCIERWPCTPCYSETNCFVELYAL